MAGLRATAVGSRIAKDANSPQSQWAAARRRFVHSGTGMLGAALLVLFLLIAVFAAQVSPYDPIHQDFRIERETPSAEHLMGTDEFGRDVFSRVVWGARVSLQAGAIAASIALVVGLALGMTAAYYRGRTDGLVMRAMDVLLAFPYLLLAIGIVAILGPGLLTAMIAIGIVYIPNYARVVRGAVLSVGARDFVEAARAVGARDRRVMWRHILPNVLAPIIVQELVKVIGQIVRAGEFAVIVVEQHARLALGLTTQAIVLDRGCVVHRAASEALLADPATLDRLVAVA